MPQCKHELRVCGEIWYCVREPHPEPVHRYAYEVTCDTDSEPHQFSHHPWHTCKRPALHVESKS